MNHLKPQQKHTITIKGTPTEVEIVTVRRHDKGIEATLSQVPKFIDVDGEEVQVGFEERLVIVSEAKSWSEYECDVKLANGRVIHGVPGDQFEKLSATKPEPEVLKWDDFR